MNRRSFVTVLGGAAAWPLVARAEQVRRLPTIGILNSVSPATLEEMLAGFRRGLSEAGFDDNRNVRLEYRWAEGHYERLPALAADLIAHRPVVIFATGDAPWPAKEATNTIPIVFATGVDPIDTRLVASLDKPGGNVTGISWSSNALVPKRLELVRDLVPHIGVISALVNTKNPSAEIDIRALRAAAAALRLKVEVHGASTMAEVAEAFATMARQKVEAVIVGADSFFVNQRKDIVALEARYALPGSHSIREYVVDGGLMSYAPNRLESFRVAGSYVGRILKGEKAADLPVQLPTRFELAINLKTAKALGLDMPASVLARADEVIE